MKSDEKIIKENFGSKMWELCERLFPEYLEVEGVISEALLSIFHPIFCLADIIVDSKAEDSFKKVIVSTIEESAKVLDKIFHDEIMMNFFEKVGGGNFFFIDGRYCFMTLYYGTESHWSQPTIFSNGIIWRDGQYDKQYQITGSDSSERYILFDFYLLDLEEKKISFLIEDTNDSFVDEFKDADGKSTIEDIVISQDQDSGNRNIEITYDNGKVATIVVDRDNRMLEYHNPNLLKIPNGCLMHTNLTILDVPNVVAIGSSSLLKNNIRHLKLPLLETTSDYSLEYFPMLETIHTPKLKGFEFLNFRFAPLLKEVYSPEARRMNGYVFHESPLLTNIKVSEEFSFLWAKCLTKTQPSVKMEVFKAVIANNYGKEMLGLCLELFPDLFNRGAQIPYLLLLNFSRNLNLGNDIISGNRKYVFSKWVSSSFENSGDSTRFDLVNLNLGLEDYCAIDHKFYKSIFKVSDGNFVAPNNIFIRDFKVINKYSKEPERYIIFNCFLLDLKEKKISCLFGEKTIYEAFVNGFKDSDGQSTIESIVINEEQDSGNRNIEITYDNGKVAIITIDKINRIVDYRDKTASKFFGRKKS